MGRTGIVFSIIAMVVGAVMYWGVSSSQSHGFRLSTVGVILMIAGAVGFVTSAIAFGMSRRTGPSQHSTFDRKAVDADGMTTVVHEEVR